MPKQKQINADQFSPQEQAQIQRYGQALTPPPTDFDDEVEKELAKHYPHEASYEKMKAALTGGASELGPSDIEQEQAQGAAAAQRATATAQAVQAAQAQAQQTSPQPPPAPAGPVGVSTPYPAQKGPQPPPSAPGGVAGSGPEEGTEESD